MDRNRKLVVGLLFLGLLIAFAGINLALRKNAAKPENRTQAPPWTARDLKGGLVKSTDFQGKVVFLDFWATWCPPCVESIPELNEFQEKYGKDGFEIIALSVDDSAEEVEKWAAKEKVSFKYKVVMAEKETIDAYKVEGFPTTYIIDRDGNIAAHFPGAEDKKVYEEVIEKLIKESPKAAAESSK